MFPDRFSPLNSGRRVFRAVTFILCPILCVMATELSCAAQSLSGYERALGRQMLELTKADIKKNYYDPTVHGMDLEAHFKAADEEIKNASTLNEILGIIAKALTDINDSHTFFIPPTMTHRVDYGWYMQAIGDKSYVVAVKPGSDAERKGMKAGDRVLDLDGITPTRNQIWKMKYNYRVMPRAGMRVMLQSPDGQTREIEAMAKVELDPRVNSTSRYDYYVQSVRDFENEAPLYKHRYYHSQDIVIWKMPDFSFDEATAKEIISKVRNSKALILDLRGNPGGYVKTLEVFMGHFFEQDVKVADLKSRKEMKPIIAKSPGKNSFKGRVVVLVDSNSASATEIFARLMQLEKRGTVIGDLTAGAVTQSKFFLHEGGANNAIAYGAYITNADMLMPDGKSLEKVGVTPDEVLLPSAADLAAKRDPVLARAAALVGVELSAEKAGSMFPIEWPK
jgi:carboxyl-terminal processing protease